MSNQPWSTVGAGPSPALLAWRRFLVETIVCLVLVAALVLIALEGRHDLLAGSTILALTGMIVRIVRQ
jgi:hypothetical protein